MRRNVPLAFGAGLILLLLLLAVALTTLALGAPRFTWANEGVRVNAVRAGLVITDIHASTGEPGRPERIAPTVPMQRAGAGHCAI